MAGLDTVAASQVCGLQFAFATGGKLVGGVLLSMPRVPRTLLYVATPAAFCASHLLLVDFSPSALLLHGASLSGAIVVTRSMSRLVGFAALAGLTFGIEFGVLMCLPLRLFGRAELPRLQSYVYAAILASAATFGPLVGYLRDAGGGYQLPIALTFVATFVEAWLCASVLRKADARADARADAHERDGDAESAPTVALVLSPMSDDLQHRSA